MFEKFNQIGDDIYVYKNFVSQEDCKKVFNYLDNLEESEWNLPNEFFINVSKITKPLDLIVPIREKIKNILPKNIFLGEGTSAARMLKTNEWGVHADVHDFDDIEKQNDLYVDGDLYREADLSIYGTVVYFNNFEGGEIFYPFQNIIYKPNPGDLIIHGSGKLTSHGVKKVLSEKRYSYSNHIYKKVKIPIK